MRTIFRAEGYQKHLAEAKAVGNVEATAASGKCTPFISIISDYKGLDCRNCIGIAILSITQTFIPMRLETLPLYF